MSDMFIPEQILNTVEYPCYVYNINKIEEQICNLKESFTLFHFLYSIKSNPNKEIIKKMVEHGIGFDAASVQEIELALKNGGMPANIYYSSPGKTKQDISIGCKLCNHVADSMGELYRINSLAKNSGCILEVGIRLNISNARIKNSKHEIMGGIPTKFGIDYDTLDTEEIKKLTNIRIVGLHVYYGSQLLDLELIHSNFVATAVVACFLKEIFPIKYINFGGGFGVQYATSDVPLDIVQLAYKVQADDNIQCLKKENILLNIELGRYFVAECGLFLAVVTDIKKIYNKHYAIIDGGMNTFFRPMFTGDFHEVKQLTKRKSDKERYTIVGNLCTPIDQYYEDYPLYPLKENDVLVFKNAGAYGRSMSLTEFITRKTVPEYIFRW